MSSRVHYIVGLNDDVWLGYEQSGKDTITKNRNNAQKFTSKTEAELHTANLGGSLHRVTETTIYELIS